MRYMRGAAMPLMLTMGLAACGSDPAPAPQPEEKPIVMQGGQWELTRRTTGYNTPTVTPAEYQQALKQIGEEKLCLAVDKDGVPDPNALAGAEGTECSYKDKMLRKGRLIATLSCKAGAGTAEIAVEGNYTADTLTLGTTMTKTEGGQPVLRTTHDLTGQRTGDCPKA
ncbi:DUF3617 domain-containing protein [Sphingobium sp. CCH11-B1]|uniref:DUF3617 domain-containing protein n=1 Tax=Sphingobium sp. CCH11-B1 TaxID=1768781 RepID=UPI0008344A05|nr:DUF3617 domain-containing protein [Sphingobium sp. CCH11-B1]MEA3388731.1 DUF3617 domain-containing protein [Pseudomonadota bacterium]